MINPTVPKISFAKNDFRIEWYSGTGAGGQHRNRHMNSCRLVHIPTGQVVTAQCRSRENSYNEAWSTMQNRLDNAAKSVYNSNVASNRKEQVGSGMRGDKIRTYRFQDDIVKDHNTGKSASCDKVMRGNFELIW